jgi:hypothetical protein
MRLRYLSGLLTLLALGCSGERIVPVSGRITLDGRPLANGVVNFQPVAQYQGHDPGPGSYGKTDAQGYYTLRVVGRDHKGAVVGTHRVQITGYAGAVPKVTSDSNPQLPPQLVPRWYNSETQLTCEVPRGGTDHADFELTSTAPPKGK